MNVIVPTIGRRVWYYPAGVEDFDMATLCEPEAHMSKTKATSEADRVEAAIRGLYQNFPTIEGCSRANTAEVLAIKAKIAARKEMLAKDKELAALEKQLKDERKRVMQYATKGRARVNALLRSYQLRGVTEKLLCDIEKLSEEVPVQLLTDCY